MNGKDNYSEKTLEFDELLATTKIYLTFLSASNLTTFQSIVRAAIRSNFLNVTPLIEHIDSSVVLG